MTSARPPGRRSRRSRWRRPAGWTVVGVGAVLALYGYLGNALGVSIPLEPHHVPSQAAGIVLVLVGLMWVLSDER